MSDSKGITKSHVCSDGSVLMVQKRAQRQQDDKGVWCDLPTDWIIVRRIAGSYDVFVKIPAKEIDTLLSLINQVNGEN